MKKNTYKRPSQSVSTVKRWQGGCPTAKLGLDAPRVAAPRHVERLKPALLLPAA